MMVLTAEQAHRLEAKIEPQDDADGCWFWMAAKNPHGYGVVKIRQRNYLAHRAVYEHFVGPIPQGLQLDHLCRNRACVRPEHLEPVTSRENTMRGEGVSAKCARKTHCPRGHAYDEKNTRMYRGIRYCRACVPHYGRINRARDVAREERAS